MTRTIILGNGNMLVCLDGNARIRDFYYPHIGQDNHVSGRVHRIGVLTDAGFSWVSSENWDLSIKYKKDALVSEINAYNKHLNVGLTMNEVVHHEKNIYLRKLKIENKNSDTQNVKIFFGQEFNISETNIGDTAYFDPTLDSIVHYKGKRYFLIGGESEGKLFDDYATGVNESNDKIGTYKDAEDGILSKNAIEHGSVDSAIGFSLVLKGGEKKEINYWIAVGEKYKEISALKDFIKKETPEKLINETEECWKKWVNKCSIKFYELSEEVQDLFRRSLLIINAQTNKNGAIIASNDTHNFKFKKDTYSYMWPRDGALVARSFDKAGYSDITNRFFEFCSRVLSDGGFLFPKYRPDRSVGSSWHSWLSHNKIQLPIQEDETALVLDSLWKHYKRNKNEDVKKLYGPLIKNAGNFLVDYRDEKMKLPKESYDLWEEKLGIHTFTCATVYAGLEAAKNFAEIFGEKHEKEKYEKAAQEVKDAILKYLYDKENGIFVKRIYSDEEGNWLVDSTIDVSTVYGLFEYKILPADDERIVRTMEKTMEKLWCITPTGGVCRYENDKYYRTGENAPENPWFISTFWLAEYYIEKAKKIEDLKLAEDLLKWAVNRALPSGVLSEQLNPNTAEPLSVSPLTWSHAGFIIAVIKYVGKYETLKGIKKK